MGIVEDVHTGAARIGVALESSGYRADFSPPTLWEIDRFFDEQAPNGRAARRGLLSHSLGQRLFGLGAYVGEVIRQAIGGHWEGDDDDPNAEISVTLVLDDGTRLWPVQRVMKRFSQGPENAIAAYAAALGVPVGERPEPPDNRRRPWFGR